MSNGSFAHLLGLLIVLGRAADIGSTWLVTPTLALEANPIVRRLGWPFALTSFVLVLVPYYDTRLGVMMAVPSFVIAGGNLMRGWTMRALGETEWRSILHRCARTSRRGQALAFTLGAALCIAVPGVLLMLIGGGQDSWAFWFAMGWLAYAAVIAVHGSAYVFRTFREARATAPA